MACCFWGSTVAFGGGGREHYNIDIVARKRRRKEMMMRMKIVKAMRSDRRTLLHSFSDSSSLSRFQGAESFRSRTNSMASSSSSSNGSDGDGNDKDIVTFSSKISADIPLYQPPGVSLDDYITDQPRIFRAMFPDKHGRKQLNDEEGRIKMLPVKFFFVSAEPEPTVTSLLTNFCRQDGRLKDLEGLSMPSSNFKLKVQVILYSVNRGAQICLKGNLEMSISLVLSHALASLIPIDALKVVTESVKEYDSLILDRIHISFVGEVMKLTGCVNMHSGADDLVERMKGDADAGLLSDFSNYRREKLEKDI